MELYLEARQWPGTLRSKASAGLQWIREFLLFQNHLERKTLESNKTISRNLHAACKAVSARGVALLNPPLKHACYVGQSELRPPRGGWLAPPPPEAPQRSIKVASSRVMGALWLGPNLQVRSRQPEAAGIAGVRQGQGVHQVEEGCVSSVRPTQTAVPRKTPVTDKNGRKRPSAGPVEEEVGAEVQNMLETLGADIKNALMAKRRRFEMNTTASVKSSNQKIEHVWKIQQEQWQKLTRDYSQQFLALFQQCHGYQES
ncbi:uncharacterized protein PS065_021891 [Dugong dugon]